MNFSLETVRSVAQLLNEHDLAEISVEHAGTPHDEETPGSRARLVLRRETNRRAARPKKSRPTVIHAQSQSPAAAPIPSATTHKTVSEVVGMFRPLIEPVQVGDVVSDGQRLGVVEVLNVSNDIKATVAGRITQIFIEDGQAVEWGQQLFEIAEIAAAGDDPGAVEEA